MSTLWKILITLVFCGQTFLVSTTLYAWHKNDVFLEALVNNQIEKIKEIENKNTHLQVHPEWIESKDNFLKSQKAVDQNLITKQEAAKIINTVFDSINEANTAENKNNEQVQTNLYRDRQVVLRDSDYFFNFTYKFLCLNILIFILTIATALRKYR